MAITVDTAAESEQLTTLANFKEYLTITVATDDTLIGNLIDRASKQIVSYTRREFAAQVITETLEGRFSQLLRLKRFPIISITTIKLETVLVPAADYTVQRPAVGMVFREDKWEDTFAKYDYEVVYEYGFNLPSFTTNPLLADDLPEDIELAAILLTKAMFLSRKRDSALQKETIPAVYSATYGGGSSGSGGDSLLTPEIQTLLEPFRMYRI